MQLSQYFNSQPHEEADYSTATVLRLYPYFNSQPHEEADIPTPSGTAKDMISTHSLTKRLTNMYHNFLEVLWYFNSQPHEEADVMFFQCLYSLVISTHSLTKRLTQKAADAEKEFNAFQLTASRRG